MRRMYSEQELTQVINEVISSKIEAGAFDEVIADAVDDYLVEHPVDVTALNGQTITPAVVNATTSMSAPAITGDSIIENMSGYSFTPSTAANITTEVIYAGAVKNGNKLTLALAVNVTASTTLTGTKPIGVFTVPVAIASKLIPSQVGLYYFLDNRILGAFDSYQSAVECLGYIDKSDNSLGFGIKVDNLVAETKYFIRYEATFLLSDSLAS